MSARYSRTTGYTIAKRNSRPATRTVQRRVKFGPTTAKFFGLAVLAILAIIMLSQASTNNLAAYRQNALRKESGQVSADIQRLQLEADRAKTINNLQQTQVQAGMEAMGEPEFVEAGDVAGVSTERP